MAFLQPAGSRDRGSPGSLLVMLHSALAATVASDLYALYGRRLRQVLVFGSRARGDHREDSDLDLLVVLADPVDRSMEMRAMDDVLWRHTLASDVVITSFPVGESEWLEPRIPLLIEAAKDAVPA